ncbi:MAG: PilZ domain-containing protein [Candidatus Omnitrophica bacterium]|nr:PilZ domain-containing protein [Candidatus Omnitrophota bacterium]
MWSGIDKRRFPRARYRCKIFIRRKDSMKTISATTENIGGGGICVVLGEDLGLFHGCDLEVTLDDGESAVTCAGTVVWVVKKRRNQADPLYTYDTGIEFVDISDDDVKRILKIVEKIIDDEKPSA